RWIGKKLNDSGFTYDGFECGFAQTDDAWFDAVCRAQIHEDDVVMVMVDDAVQKCNQFGVFLSRQSALKDGQLQPFSVAVHDAKYPAPTFWVGNVVSHCIQMF